MRVSSASERGCNEPVQSSIWIHPIKAPCELDLSDLSVYKFVIPSPQVHPPSDPGHVHVDTPSANRQSSCC